MVLCRVKTGSREVVVHFLAIFSARLKMDRPASNFIKNLIKIDRLDMKFHVGQIFRTNPCPFLFLDFCQKFGKFGLRVKFYDLIFVGHF